MQLIYEGKDIVDNIDIQSCKIYDVSGEKFDFIEIIFNNTENQWSTWKPEIDQKVCVKHQGFSSGDMYINAIQQLSGCLKMICIPIKHNSKEKRTKSWEYVTLMELLNELANRHNLELKTYGIFNHMYSGLMQADESDFTFISKRCLIEGYIMKVSDNSLVVYDERLMESQDPIDISRIDVIGEFNLHNGSSKMYGSVKLGEYLYKLECIPGPLLTLDIQVDSIGESERFAKNLLRAANKYQWLMDFDIKFNPGIAAGCVVNLTGFGLADNKYYVYQCTQNLGDELTSLKLRTIPGW